MADQVRSEMLSHYAQDDEQGKEIAREFLNEARQKMAEGYRLEEISPDEFVWVREDQ